METKINKEMARKVLKIVDSGLVSGMGVAEPGKMCVEAAVCYAMGLPHSDNPPCVGESVRHFKIALNDCRWSSNEARTKGMRKLAIAQLGSNEIDQKKFIERVGFECITKILPVIIKNALEEDKDNKFVKDRKDEENLTPLLKKLSKAKTYKEAGELVEKVWEVYAFHAAAAADSASSYASSYAYAYASSYAYVYASSYARAVASSYVNKNPTFSDKILNMTAEAGLNALKKLKSPGVKWLDLCE
jgi:hypothetical protein